MIPADFCTYEQEVWDLAEFMHDKYLELSIEAGWDVQEGTDVLFEDLPRENMKVMLDLASKVVGYFADREDKK